MYHRKKDNCKSFTSPSLRSLREQSLRALRENIATIFQSLFIILIFLLHSHGQISAQQLSDNAQFSLLTCDPGDELYSTFGHSAIRLTDSANDLDIVFNYGTFDFDEPNFGLKFLRGKLLYALGISTFDQFLVEYKYYRRGVSEQLLDLDHESKIELYQYLQINYQPGNRFYLYDFFFDNCSSRIRDLFEDLFPDHQYQNTAERDITYRQLLYQYLSEKSWLKFGIDLIIGSIADKPADWRAQMFLPDYLHDNLENFYFSSGSRQSKKLITDERPVLDFELESKNRSLTTFLTPALWAWILVLLEIAIFLRFSAKWIKLTKIYDRFWFILLALSSWVMIFMWGGTDHQACRNNWNLLWANPAFIIIPFLKWQKKNNGAEFVSKFILICCIFALIGARLIPQQFNAAIYPIVLIIILKLIRCNKLLNLKCV